MEEDRGAQGGIGAIIRNELAVSPVCGNGEVNGKPPVPSTASSRPALARVHVYTEPFGGLPRKQNSSGATR